MEYLTNRFQNDEGIWRLSGTQYGNGVVASSAIDTFKNETTGEFRDILRIDVFNDVDLKYVEPKHDKF